MELNSNLRHMPEIQNIAAYLREMSFKRKTFGGCDEESVLDHISHITLQYEAIISTLLTQGEQNAGQVAAMQAMLTQAEKDSASVVQWHEQMNAHLQAENSQLRQQCAALEQETGRTRSFEAPRSAWNAPSAHGQRYAGYDREPANARYAEPARRPGYPYEGQPAQMQGQQQIPMQQSAQVYQQAPMQGQMQPHVQQPIPGQPQLPMQQPMQGTPQMPVQPQAAQQQMQSQPQMPAQTQVMQQPMQTQGPPPPQVRYDQPLRWQG